MASEKSRPACPVETGFSFANPGMVPCDVSARVCARIAVLEQDTAKIVRIVVEAAGRFLEFLGIQTERPHSSLGSRPPASAVVAWPALLAAQGARPAIA